MRVSYDSGYRQMRTIVTSSIAPQIESLSVPLEGMTKDNCLWCADRLRDAIQEQSGVVRAEVNPRTATLQIEYDPAMVSPAALTETARHTQSEIAQRYAHRTYNVVGMDCAHCAEGLEQMACTLPGVVSASVQFSAAKMRVEYDAADSVGIEQISRRAQSMGFTLSDINAAKSAAEGENEPWYRRIWSPVGRAVLSLALLGVGILLESVFHSPEIASRILYGLSIAIGGYRFALTGLAALRSRVIGTNLLMALAAVGAIWIGHWEEAAMVVSLYAIGIALEGAAFDRTRRSLKALIDARPTEALVRRADGTEETVPAESLVVGDVLVVRPGAHIAADGVILSGSSAISEAAITGESTPRDKTVGEAIYTGSVNGNGFMTVRVTATGEDSTLARMLHLVEEAQAQKAPTQTIIEKFGRVYTPLVLIVAVGVGVLGPLVAPGSDWTYRALTLLVVSCPCALIIATPVAYVSAIARAAKNGVLVKGGAYLEALATAKTVSMDKTGTLTTGLVRVVDVVPVRSEPNAERDLLALAAAVERQSEHPIALAVVKEAEHQEAGRREARDAVAIPGRGITATVDGQTVIVGNRAMLTQHNLVIPAELDAQERTLSGAGKTTLFVAEGDTVIGVIAIADTIRPETPAAIAELKAQGRSIMMLTGDNAAVAQSVGQTLGITDIGAGLLPENKLTAVQEATAKGSVVFVGDGINDAPALAAATVGVAMGAGTAAALEAADIALVQSDLSRIPWVFRLAEATQGIVRFNVGISIAAVVLLLVGTLSGWLTLPLGVLGHEGSALLVILNGIRLLSPRLTSF